MDVHIFKGQAYKSVILEKFFMDREKTVCFVYYDSSRPYPAHIHKILMADRSVINIDMMVAGIRMLVDSGIMDIVIYTNYTEEENKELIKALENIEDKFGVVIIMCQD